MNRNQNSGVALVTTLIMLSLVTFLTVAFLKVSQRERVSVTVAENQNVSDWMAEAGLQRAIAEVVSKIVSQSNAFAYDFQVSTNYVNPNGFDGGDSSFNPNNVGYTDANGFTLSSVNQARNIANLQVSPRPPVYIDTNRSSQQIQGPLDFRYYLDFNRNGFYETNGWVPEIGFRGVPTGNTNLVVGDPEWIGILENPTAPHSGSNEFVGRYCFLILPTGKSLDLNYIHNKAKRTANNVDGFVRNQGVGSWEINLGGFLHDLNTNSWRFYQYFQSPNRPNTGTAFTDANTLLMQRYQNNLFTLSSLRSMFGPRGDSVFANDLIDIWSDGPFTNATGSPLIDNDQVLNPGWPGADNTNSFNDPQEVYNPTLTSLPFQNRFRGVMGRPNTYDRYSFYRFLSQMGVDSVPAAEGKINLNFRSDTGGTATNLVAWTAGGFFTNAAERMLRTQFSFGITNIQIWPQNNYSAGVHRMLQLAANIYDASTNQVQGNFPDLPSVYRPRFRKNSDGTIQISGYVEERNSEFMNVPWRDLSIPSDRNALQPDDMIFGMPIVVGAKKGFPNFNEVALQTTVQVARKLQVVKNSPRRAPIQTNQMYIVGVSNLFGIEAWNSYQQAYPRALTMSATNRYSVIITNEFGNVLLNRRFVSSIRTNIASGNWSGNQFLTPILTNIVALPDSVYFTQPPLFVPVTNIVGDLNNVGYDVAGGLRVPRWGMTITNQLQYVLIDQGTRRVVDFVNLGPLVSEMDITSSLVGSSNARAGTSGGNSAGGQFWTLDGAFRQIGTSLGLENFNSSMWVSENLQPASGRDKEKAINFFRVFMNPNTGPNNLLGGQTQFQLQQILEGLGNSLTHATPFSPVRKVFQSFTWQANDPLVHYTVQDLFDPVRTNNLRVIIPPINSPTNENLGIVNRRYQPWGNAQRSAAGDPSSYNQAFKDPLVYKSDDWFFPSNKFPSIGWLGRVHRGTPWQTFYLKSGSADLQEWFNWAGDRSTHPTNDWKLVDLFTTAFHPNASRGLLSVNQTNIASWSAVLSGVDVITNTVSDVGLIDFQIAEMAPPVETIYVQPNSPQLKNIVAGINKRRLDYPGGSFPLMGAILSVPELTDELPYLNLSTFQKRSGISDAAYEQIPLKILSLVKEDSPRFVVYAYGQSLVPARNNARVLSPGVFFRLCTNYTIQGEVAVKALVRIDGGPSNPRAIIETYEELPPQ
ncbi:MAG TPA: hypothetical protein EYQ50_13660 [Verrucomicrobiales bacterium]|nr:hypothetical protein [Verrucomicrobiales bacterium]